MTIRSLRGPRPFPRLFLLLLSVFLLIPSFQSHDGFLAAQKSRGKPYAVIVGTVWGPDDRPVYGVTVQIRRAKDKKPKWEVYSDHRGEFEQRLPAGEADYILSADLKRFKPADGKPLHLVQEVTVHVYNDERQDTSLHLSY